MRVDKLWIHEFKNLKNFEIDFNENEMISVIVGRNGTGKSNILEALVVIFRDLDLKMHPMFKYKIWYHIRDNYVFIDAEPNRYLGKKRDFYRITIRELPNEEIQQSFDNIDVPQKENKILLKEMTRDTYLPRYLFGYYSGPSNRLEEHFEPHQKKFRLDLLDGKDEPLRPLLYARNIHSQFVLLAFFIDNDPQTKKFLANHLGIVSFDSVLFAMREPLTWNSKVGDKRFWNARGTVTKLLDALFVNALAPLRLTHRTQVGLGNYKNKEHLYLYFPNQEVLRKVAQQYVSPQEFFKALESTYISDLVSSVHIRVRIHEKDGQSLTFRELSEGEQQLLTVLGLMRFTKEEESLFLLDEPDTHLNPNWSITYLQLISNIVGAQKNSQVILNTHNPLTISSLVSSQVKVIHRAETGGTVYAESAEYDPKGLGVEGILTSDMFGLATTLDPETQQKLDERNSLIAKDERTATEDKRMHTLTDELANLGFARTNKDPIYQKYLQGMAEYRLLIRGELTQELKENEEKLVQEILAEIHKEDEGIDDLH